MGSDFVYGVINAIDGERDPRTLYSIFEFLPTFLRTFSLGHLAEEMFEVCACYFPVDFHPAPDDPTSISRDGLAERLARCMCGHPEFAEFCVPLALEKLNSQLTVAKLDSLNLLILGAQNFPTDQIESHFNDIWPALHVEIRLKDDKPTDISILALTTLRTIVQSTSYNETLCHNVLTTVLDTILSSVTDPDSKQFATSTTIALTAASASKYSSLFVAKKVLPLLVLQSELFRDNAQRLAQIRELIAHVVEACVHQKVTTELDAEVVNAIRAEYMAGLTTDNGDAALSNALVCLTKTVAILNEHNRLQVYSHVNDLLQSGSAQIVGQLRELVFALAADNPKEFRATFLDNWLQSDVVNATNGKQIFEMIGSLVKIPEFTHTALEYLLRAVFERSSLQHLAVHTLESLLENGIEATAFDVLYTNFNVVERLCDLIRLESTEHTDLRANVSHCIRMIVQQLETTEQTLIIDQPFVATLDLSSVGDLYLAAAIVGAVRPEVPIDVHKFVLDVARQAMTSSESHALQLGCQLMCSVLNKAPRTERNDEAVAALVSEVRAAIGGGNASAVRLSAWIAKGLLVRGDNRADGIVTLVTF